MRVVCCLLLFSSLALAQAQTPAQTPAGKPAPNAAPASHAPAAKPESSAAAKPSTPAAAPDSVPETATVLTVNGVCMDKPANPADCKTLMSRAEFEKILGAVTPSRAGAAPTQLPPNVRRNMATQYSQLLAVAASAEKAGVEQTPQAQELLKFARMQALAQAYSRQLQEKLQPTDAEIQAYYNANSSKLEEATLERVFIPKSLGENGKTPNEAAEKANAEKFHTRAAAGEPFDKLQKEALTGTNFPTPPQTKMVVQKGTMPPSQQAVFNLKPGETSELLVEPSGYYIYKLDSKSTIPLEQVKSEIQMHLLQEKMQAAMDAILKSATPVLNEQYFGPPAPEQAAPGAAKQGPGAGPSSKPTPSGAEKPRTTPPPK